MFETNLHKLREILGCFLIRKNIRQPRREQLNSRDNFSSKSLVYQALADPTENFPETLYVKALEYRHFSNRTA